MKKLNIDSITVDELLERVEACIKKVLNNTDIPVSEPQENFRLSKSMVARHFKRSYPTVTSAIRRAITDNVLPVRKHNEFTLSEWKKAFSHYESTRYNRGLISTR